MIKALYLISLILLQASSIKIFLLGGATADNETQIYTNIALASGRKPYPNNCGFDWDSTECPRIAVVTSAAGSQTSGNDAFNVDDPGSLSYKTIFMGYGFSPKHASVHIDNYVRTTNLSNTEAQLNFDILKQADVIFFNGGDQSRHARCWLNDDGTYNPIMKMVADRARNNEVILAGTSAGSMIMCSPIYGQGSVYGHLFFAAKVGLDKKKVADGVNNGTQLHDIRNGTFGLQFQENGGIMPGFNFTPFLVDSHVNTQGRLGRIIPGMIQARFQIGIAVQQSSGLYYDNGKGTIYGRGGAYVVDLSSAVKTSKEYFAVNNVMVSYLTSGDSYDFQTKKVTPHSSKALITKPAYGGHYDSTDIFAADETTKVITRLGDQNSTYNIGRSRIPSGYPSNAPVFRLTFEKGSSFSSYWSSSQRKYTDANATVHFTYE